ncbi:hypothetical protein PGH12_09745 [Chryseobacterium wangxinyae]|uniref:hypothetical protein n=1 Tax=Chryseobacterium sp. CY350 TaxID=2997336 RepID=UPI00226D9A4E|nr:hypothetical protein [Chryseobacterium sp. CY350]MCY0978854.1 hypothetical protein [Chryseobacterium sp. CY350]WBZ93769.1 hypothetical protein PGH12_09745 [Chryseobacterium sp. CY350]
MSPIKSSHAFRFILLVSLLLFNFSKSQDKKQTGSIVLEKGAQIYSSDEFFNNQIAEKKVILKNAAVTIKANLKNEKILSASFPNHSNDQDLAIQAKAAEEKKSKDEIKQIKKEIDQYETQSKSNGLEDYEGTPSPSQFFSSHSASKNYIAPSQNVQVFSKISAAPKNYCIKRALDYLHTQQFEFYNNKSLDFCFSEIFSVRPPPIFNI